MFPKYKAIVIGTSAGGLFAISALLEKLPEDYPVPIIIVQHRSKEPRDLLEEVLQAKCRIRIKQADEKERIESGFAYIAPPDYHLLIEEDQTFSLTADEYVRFSRPSIDVLFETAAAVFGKSLAGIILTGANNDGAAGIKAIKKYGGTTIAQAPDEAQYPYMPKAAINTNAVMHTWTLPEIQNFLLKIIAVENEEKR
jgi:two-component system, chemotaxis family, protein-glutamate methylesterase/glutaminase